uniref:CBFD_NFYB_HMF domain-containing protein n=1 Tax=Panagrellus redivivus TaxID=6233 RepID=A0A7E4VRR3_PANRE
MAPPKRSDVAERVAETWFENVQCDPSAMMEINNLKGIFAEQLIARASDLTRLRGSKTIDVKDLQDALSLMSSSELTTMIRRDADRAVADYREKMRKKA